MDSKKYKTTKALSKKMFSLEPIARQWQNCLTDDSKGRGKKTQNILLSLDYP